MVARRLKPRTNSYPLIRPGDPPPFTIHNPDGRAPILIVCDHASRAFPDNLDRLGLAEWVLDRHVACDIGAAKVARLLADRFDAPAVLAGYSRLIVDLNRRTDDPTCFIKVCDGITVPGILELTDYERERRIDSFFRPYHHAIASQLDNFEAIDVIPVFIAVHSCTPVYDRFVRPWHIGILWDRDPRIALPVMKKLCRLDGICVGDNEPYSGKHPHDFTVDHHAESARLPNINFEFRQDLIETDTGAAEWATITGDVLEDILADESLYSRLEDEI